MGEIPSHVGVRCRCKTRQEGPNRQFNLPTETAFKVDIAGSWAVEPEKELVWVCYPVTHDPNYVPPPTSADD